MLNESMLWERGRRRRAIRVFVDGRHLPAGADRVEHFRVGSVERGDVRGGRANVTVAPVPSVTVIGNADLSAAVPGCAAVQSKNGPAATVGAAVAVTVDA